MWVNIQRLTGVSHCANVVWPDLAVDAVNLDIPAGCMAGFIGPARVGKSSRLALISGARKIQAGRVNALGGDMAKARHRNAVCPYRRLARSV
jgi:ribosome-dependent ATPase